MLHNLHHYYFNYTITPPRPPPPPPPHLLCPNLGGDRKCHRTIRRHSLPRATPPGPQRLPFPGSLCSNRPRPPALLPSQLSLRRRRPPRRQDKRARVILLSTSSNFIHIRARFICNYIISYTFKIVDLNYFSNIFIFWIEQTSSEDTNKSRI